MFKKAKKLKDPSDAGHGYNYAMFLLGLRLRTEGEVREKMCERGYNSEVIDNVLAQLLELKYLDDNRFAEVLIENYKLYKSYGYYKVKIKLLEKRLPSGFIEQVLDELYPVEEEISVAERWLKKEYPKYVTNPKEFSFADKQKIGKKLQSRGFRMDVISKLVFSR